MKVILLWALLMIAGCALKAQSTPEEKLMQTLYAITNLYVDSISKEAYINHTIAEMMRKLDPFLNTCRLYSCKAMSRYWEG